MPRVSGNYTLPPGYRAVSGEIIRPSQHNPPLEDIAQALTDSLPRDGSAPMTGNLPMGGNTVTGMPDLTVGAVNPAATGTVGVEISDVGRVTAQVASDATSAGSLFVGYTGDEVRFRVRPDGAGYIGAGGAIPANAIVTQGTLDTSIAGFVPNTRRVDAGSGLTGGGNLQGDRTLSVDGTVVRTSRSVISGAGLVFGGDLSQDRTIAMGTPSAITATSTNEAVGETHTHSLPAGSFRSMMAIFVGAGDIGSMVFGSFNGATPVSYGQNRPGANITPASERGATTHRSGSVTGTWKCLGYIGDADSVTLWMRVS